MDLHAHTHTHTHTQSFTHTLLYAARVHIHTKTHTLGLSIIVSHTHTYRKHTQVFLSQSFYRTHVSTCIHTHGANRNNTRGVKMIDHPISLYDISYVPQCTAVRHHHHFKVFWNCHQALVSKYPTAICVKYIINLSSSVSVCWGHS